MMGPEASISLSTRVCSTYTKGPRGLQAFPSLSKPLSRSLFYPYMRSPRGPQASPILSTGICFTYMEEGPRGLQASPSLSTGVCFIYEGPKRPPSLCKPLKNNLFYSYERLESSPALQDPFKKEFVLLI